jgi:peroxiredoxin Q/BCP
MSAIGVGDIAPQFSLKDQKGATVHLKDFRGKSWVVLYFYPKDNTTGCTAQACSFRDAYQDFKDAGAEVIGISSDSEEKHQGFADQYRLPFILVADVGGAARKAFGVPRTFGLLPGRVTYVIDPEGTVRHVFNSQLKVHKHVDEALAVIRSS